MEGGRESQVPDHFFNAFHSIDRELYTRLVRSLRRDPAESIRLMAFWLFLEREIHMLYLVKGMLSLPPNTLRDVAEETATCLTGVYKNEQNPQFEMVLLPELIGNRNMGFQYFMENRDAVMNGINKLIQTVCNRAFRDIYQQTMSERVSVPAPASAPSPAVYPPIIFPDVRGNSAGNTVAPFPPLPPFVPGSGLNMGIGQSLWGNPVSHRLPPQQPPPPAAIAIPPPPPPPPQFEIPGNQHLQVVRIGPAPPPEVPADDRTVFLTFSKGYPILKEEIREFFTGRFGDFIEDLIMQEVGEEEQVLYARMVARSASVVDEIVGGNKAKYNICGKHVWARKYVKKQHQSAISGSTSI